jgi:trehalose 6-phosphate synthase/phosphatase
MHLADWAERIAPLLKIIVQIKHVFMLTPLNRDNHSPEVRKKYTTAKRRLIVLEYDGVLVPYELHYDLTTPPNDLKVLINQLSADPRNVIMLMSGRDTEHLDKFWAESSLLVAAENGAFYRVPGGSWQSLFKADNYWIDRVANAMTSLAIQYAGSFVERKTHSLVWHFRTVKHPIVAAELNQIMSAIRALNHAGQFAIVKSEFSLELRTAGIDAGSFVARWLGGQHFDFIMAIGTERLDEQLFGLLTRDAATIRVGPTDSLRANFQLRSQEEVIPFLWDFVTPAAGRESVNSSEEKTRDGNLRY